MRATAPGSKHHGYGTGVDPPWCSEIERPLGERDMGGWTAAVYTEEQQARLSVDEHGEKRAEAPSGTPAARAALAPSGVAFPAHWGALPRADQ